jgi:hypothetical protein
MRLVFPTLGSKKVSSIWSKSIKIYIWGGGGEGPQKCLSLRTAIKNDNKKEWKIEKLEFFKNFCFCSSSVTSLGFSPKVDFGAKYICEVH